jgi:hypothetical protein
MYLDIGNRSCKHDLHINAGPLPCRLVYEGSIAFTSVLLSEDSEMSLTLIHVFVQIRQTYWCPCLTDHPSYGATARVGPRPPQILEVS